MNQWYKLDNAAKIFPSVSNTSNSSVFRVSAILTDEIDREILQKSVEYIYDRFPLLFVRLHKGVFWNYLDQNQEKFFVEEESDYPCANINRKKNRGYMTRVFYYKNRLSIEVFHTLTDGGGIMEFMKSLLYYYFYFLGKPVATDGKVLLAKDDFSPAEAEDGFLSYYKKQKIPKEKKRYSYRIHGSSFESYGTNVVSGTVCASKLNAVAKAKGVTITTLLTAVMIYAIYEARIKYSLSDRPIVVTIPVNLRKAFKSTTLRNFFGIINISTKMSRETSFDELLSIVKTQFKEKTTEENLSRLITGNVKLEKNIFSRFVPLPLKIFFLNCGFRIVGESKKTITISNLGILDLPESMKQYVISTEALLYPTVKSPINCGVSTVKDVLTISFTRTIEQTDILQSFFSVLKEQTKLPCKVYSNNWGSPINEKMGELDDDVRKEYPSYKRDKIAKKVYTTQKLLFFLTVSASIISIFINILTARSVLFLWSLIVTFSLFSLWGIYKSVRSQTLPTGAKALIIYGILCVLAIVVDSCTGFFKWSTTYVIPFLTVTLNLLFTGFASAKKKNFKEYLGYLITTFFISLAPLLLFAFSLSDKVWTSLIALLSCILTTLGLFIFSDDLFKEEIQKRFHF